MVELKDCQQWEMEGKLQFHSHLMLIAQFWFLAGFNSAWAQSHSRVRFLGTPWYATHQAPLSMGFSRQEYWSRFPCPPPGDLLNPVIKPRFPSLKVHYSLSEPRRKPSILSTLSKKKKKILWSLGSGFFPLTMDHIVALDCIPNSCCTLHYQAALRSCASEANNASSDKEYAPIISCVMTLFASSVTSSSCCLHEKFLPLCRPIPIFEVLTKVHPCSYGKMHLPTTGHCSEVIHGPLQLSSKKS